MALALSATTRPAEKIGKNLNADRLARNIPAVIYGNGITAVPLFVSANDFNKVFAAAGESTLVDLSVDGQPATKVLIHDVQYHPMNNLLRHVDFYQVNMKEKISTNIPLEFVGTAPAVKDLSGIFMHPIEEIHVTCLPGDLMSKITVDISVLKDFDSVITVADLKLPASFEITRDLSEVVALVERPRSDDELAALNKEVEIDVTKVEKIEKEKKEDETDEAASEDTKTPKA